MAIKVTGKNRREYMTQTPVPQLILTLSVPTIISMMVTAIYNTADTFFVARVSDVAEINTSATAAVGLVFTVMALIQATGFFCGHGSGNYLSRMLGADNHKEASEMASTGFALALILGAIFAIVGNILAEPIASFLGRGASAQTLEFTMQYMRIILFGAPFMMAQFVVNNQLRFQGAAYYAMIGLMCGAVMNMILDPLLILVFHMGVRGAAIATVMGQATSFMVLLIGTSKGENIKLLPQNVHLNWHYIKEIVNGGAPSLFRQGLAAIATLILNYTAGSIGSDAAIAGMSVAGRIMMMLASALIGFGQGYQPVCSFNYGAGLTGRVKEGFKFCVKYSTIVLVGIGAIAYIFAPYIISGFSKDPLAITVGVAALRFQAFTLPLSGAIVISNMMLQSIGKGIKASITASARNGICFIPMILILPVFLGITGVEMAQACADVLSLFIAVPMAYSELRKF
ncbi:MatE efflux family protein [Butyrivibrio proteoclasticus B316]|uniref:Multidrug export protein MepA n=1 Tax=Butyrivibrio proteoclasticus (strain ATCC 51982 / DSM 14932 / B316) TaxID=515622 RepID=E0RYJ1_BUTPB|nr:MATE family efflux transporter [Butyrivibrio proteoclasticus]ADL33072.1 MatE efflux family protein [Butyrivibrio proteoclasticus B316]